MRIKAAIAKTIKFVVVTLSSLSVGLAAVVALSPGSPSMAKYVLEPLSYSITMESYDTISLVSLGAITGVEKVGQTLTSGALEPSGAAATYQWQRSSSAGGPYSDISGATAATYTLTPGDHNYYIRLAATGTGNYTGTVYSPYKGPVEPKTIDISAIAGIPAPVLNGVPVTTITPTDQYTGTVSWNPAHSSFGGTTTYTATITLTPKAGYTLTGVVQNFFTVASATSVTNAANSGVITAVFPSTNWTPVTAIGPISGTPMVGQTLTAGSLTPGNASANYQWQRSDSENGTYTNISGATAINYTPVPGDFGYYIKVTATGTYGYAGTVTSDAVGPVAAKTVSIAAIPGVTAPATGGDAAVNITSTGEYTGTVSWSPAPPNGKFEGDVVYTATITLSPKSGYTMTGVGANFFTVSGADSVFSPANSGVVSAVFPNTSRTPITAIGGIVGISRVGATLTAGALTPSGATATYQWRRAASAGGPYADIAGATSLTYTTTADDCEQYLVVVASGTGAYSGVATSPYKGPVGPMTIDIERILGVEPPVAGQTAALAITASEQYTGTVSWAPTPTGGVFAANTVYTATILLEAKLGYTLDGVVEDFFDVPGADTVHNSANLGVVTAIFPNTNLTPLAAIANIEGSAKVGQTLTAGALTPSSATVNYKWLKSTAQGGPYTVIAGATGSTYALDVSDLNYYIVVQATATGDYSGVAQSAPAGPVAPKTVDISAIPGLVPPETGNTPVDAITETEQYTGTVSWNPTPPGGIFAANASYTATVSLSAKTGFTFAGVASNFFSSAGASSVTNSANSNTVTVTFPNTSSEPLISIGAISGVVKVGQTLTAGSLVPSNATVVYQWQKSASAAGPYVSIPGAANASYELGSGDYDNFIRVLATGAGNYSGTVYSNYRGPVAPATINIPNLYCECFFPTNGETAPFEIIPNEQYAGSVSWSPAISGGKFAANTIYTATLNIQPKPGYTTVGVPANFFVAQQATSTTNAANSGIVTVVFPSTAKTPITAVGGIVGTARVDNVLTAGAVTPAGATVSYQWQSSSSPGGVYTNISGATQASYTAAPGDEGKYLQVQVSGTGNYSKVVLTPYKGPVEPAAISIAAIAGIASPVEGATAVSAITETAQYTGTVFWSPALDNGKFKGATVYTATITLTPKTGYTTLGVAQNFFGVAGAASVMNAANSGVVLAEFGSTSKTPITAIAPIIGTERSNLTLIAGALTPAGATANYQWQRSSSATGSYTNISGATSSSYTVAAGDVGYYIKVVATGSGNYQGVVTSPYKGPVEPTVISIAPIAGVAVPTTGATPATSVLETMQYTGTVSWNPTPPGGGFAPNTEYTATITLTPKAGYTAVGVKQNFFTVAGANTVTNSANSAVVTANFPSTALTAITAIDGIIGTDQVGKTLTAGALTPSGATATYQWQRSTSPNGPFTNITGATSDSYTVVVGYYNNYLRVVATGTGNYSGTATSPYKGPIAAAPISRAVITGITPPAKGEAVDMTVNATNEYTASISWSPSPPGGIYEGNTAYTATVTITPNKGYTVEGVKQNFFTAPGAASVTNAADSNIVYIEYPNTEYLIVTSVGVPTGTQKVGSVLSAGAIEPAGATASYQWIKSDTEDGSYFDIFGATGSSYELTADDFGGYIKVRASGTDEYAGVVTSGAAGPIAAGPITMSEILGVANPVNGATAATAVSETAQFSGTVSWSPTPVGGVFEGNTVYTATIVLAPKTGYTAVGVGEDFFEVETALSVSNDANSATVTAVFPSTALTPITEIVGITGADQVGQTLSVGTLVPSDATASYQWMRATTHDGIYQNVAGATSSSYLLLTGDVGHYFKVKATGIGDYSGTATSPYRGPVEAATYSISAIGGVTLPVRDAAPVTSITPSEQYTGSISWSPAPVGGKFVGNTVYTATITLTPKTGFSPMGVGQNFFTILGATSVFNPANSGVITAVFPSTALSPITAISATTGSVTVDETISAGTLTPADATATYQWQIATAQNGTYTNIAGATDSTYTIKPADVTKYLRVLATGTGAYSGAAQSVPVGPVAPAVVSIYLIEGIKAPVKNTPADMVITPTDQFTGTVAWDPELKNHGDFFPNRDYTATITLTPKLGYTFVGVPQNFFEVVDATSTSNPVNSNIVTAKYPSTGVIYLESFEGIGGIPMVDETLYIGELNPYGATATYQWTRSDEPDGLYYPISGATGTTYTLQPDDYNKYIRVNAEGTGNYEGNVESPYKGPIQAALVNIAEIEGVGVPVTGEAPVTSLAATAQYTLGIEWSPLVAQGVFEGEVIYTATITVTPKNGYTLQGVPEDFFSVAGVSYIACAENSGVITAEFPATEPDAGQLGFEGSFFGDLFKMFFGGKAPEGTPAPLPTIDVPAAQEGESSVTDGAEQPDDAEDADDGQYAGQSPAEEGAEPAEGEQEDESTDDETQLPESGDADDGENEDESQSGEEPDEQDEPDGLDNAEVVDQNEKDDETQAASDDLGEPDDDQRDAPVEIPLPPEEDALPGEEPDDLPPGGGDDAAGGADGGGDDDGQPADAADLN